uniref:EXS domain-containing protein n=1 Tax=Tetradesmus obliquus TaxID=3088 RepID=A0A383V567_TETOB|eukprot:jgi/Sobl393_1/11033/SZX59932.1
MVLTWLVFGGLALCSTLCAAAAAAPGVPASQPPLAPLLVPPLLYLSLAFVLLLPANVMRKQSRMFFARTALKVLVPLQPVGWADFLLADILTSLAKSSSDVTRSVCLMLHGPLAHPLHPYSATAASSCGYLTLGSLAALVLPFAIRMLQCISVWRAGGPRSQLFNALKYASSLPALILTAFEHEHHVHKQLFAWKRLWVVTMLLNSCYSFYWDVEQDWDMPWVMQYSGRRFGPLRLPALKGSHTYSSGWYAWLLLSNLLLRFTWAHRLLGDLEAHNEVLLAVALLEVLRRWQWVFGRVESETRKLGLLTSQLEDGLVTSKSGDVMVLADGAAQHAAAVAAGHGASRGASSDGVAFGGDRADVKMHLHGLLRGHVHAHANSLQEGAAVAVPLLKA